MFVSLSKKVIIISSTSTKKCYFRLIGPRSKLTSPRPKAIKQQPVYVNVDRYVPREWREYLLQKRPKADWVIPPVQSISLQTPFDPFYSVPLRRSLLLFALSEPSALYRGPELAVNTKH